MKKNKKKSIHQYMRALHRDIGFFLVGMIIIYTLSGITLIYRHTNFLKYKTVVTRQLPTGLKASELGFRLHIRDFKVTGEDATTIHFTKGTYDKKTGSVIYTDYQLPFLLQKLTELHKTPSDKFAHWITMTFAILLLFMSVSSFWMYKTTSTFFRRGIYLAGAGILGVIILLIL